MRTNAERMFFLASGAWFVLVTFVGFADTFFLRFAFIEDYGPIRSSLAIHGALYTLWMVLYAVQAGLISTKRYALHKSLGLTSVILLIAILPSGWYVVVEKFALGRKSVDEAWYNLGQITSGCVLALLAIAFRKKPYVHKRLMFAATAFLTLASVARAHEWFLENPSWWTRKLISASPLFALIAFDFIRTRRIPMLALALFAWLWAVNAIYVFDPIAFSPFGKRMLNALAMFWGLEG